MKNFSNIKPTIVTLINKILLKHNLKIYEINNIVDSEFGNDILQILVEDIEIPNKPLDFDILATVNEDISNAMDNISEIKDPYLLEIASAGIEKEIRSKQELIEALNQYVNIVFKNPINKIKDTNATLIDFGNDEFEFEYFVKGQKKKTKVKWEDIAKIRYAVKF